MKFVTFQCIKNQLAIIQSHIRRMYMQSMWNEDIFGNRVFQHISSSFIHLLCVLRANCQIKRNNWALWANSFVGTFRWMRNVVNFVKFGLRMGWLQAGKLLKYMCFLLFWKRTSPRQPWVSLMLLNSNNNTLTYNKRV